MTQTSFRYEGELWTVEYEGDYRGQQFYVEVPQDDADGHDVVEIIDGVAFPVRESVQKAVLTHDLAEHTASKPTFGL